MTTFDQLISLNEALAAKGFHRYTDFWRATLKSWYGHPTANTLIARVGRGGAKSYTSTNVGFAETLLGDYRVPPGERHYWAYVSKTKDEAQQRLNLLQALLRALGIPFEPAGEEIRLVNQPRGFRVFAANVGAVSGFRCYGYSADELAKWTAGHDYSNPAGEVCASLNAMAVSHPTARRLLISSPLGYLDYHSERFALGNTPDQIVVEAPTWIANPSISESDTRKQEPDAKIWLREYGAVPSAAVNAALDRADVEAAFAPLATNGYGAPDGYFSPRRWIGVEDPSSLRGDSYTWCRIGVLLPDPRPREKKIRAGEKYEATQLVADDFGVWRREKTTLIATSDMPLRDDQGRPIYEPQTSRPLLRVERIGGVDGRVTGQVSMSDVVRRVARTLDVRTIVGDQREEASLTALHARLGISYNPLNWTNTAKTQALATLRRMLAERAISIECDGEGSDKMKEQLLGLEEKLLPSGNWSYGARRGAHDDYAALLITACMAIDAGLVPNSEAWQSHGRTTRTAEFGAAIDF